MPGWLIWMKDMVVKRIDSLQTSSTKSKATGMVVWRVHITTISGGSVQPVMDAIDHDWGYWTWDHAGTEVTWFDWADNEPNDWHSQNCLTYLTFFDPFGFHATHWNDWDCEQTARYICEKAGAKIEA